MSFTGCFILLSTLSLASILIDCKLFRVGDLDPGQVNRGSLLNSIHVSIVHMVDLVGRACCQYSDAFENCDHKFRVQTCLQEGIKRSLLDNLIEFVKLDLFTDSTRNPHP